MRVLLVVPDFPIPKKRKIHHDFVPIGLLKIGTYLRDSKGCDVELVFGKKTPRTKPDEIWITSLFTYWSRYVREAAEFYHDRYPKARVIIGGIYASLMPEHTRHSTGHEAYVGLHNDAEKWVRNHGVDYSILGQQIDFQILHGMRGCFRRCRFCGTWKIEPEETFDPAIHEQITKNHVVFYDNNFLRNPRIKETLEALSSIRVNRKPVRFESQSGFDGRILNPELARLLKKARFINPRIAWDNSILDEKKIEEQIRMLKDAGYKSKDIYVFMLYNWEHDFGTLETKRIKCWKWKVQIADCRFRPLDQVFDEFDSRKAQSSAEYYIHPDWTDTEVKKFRANVRKHNICVRHGFRFYSKSLELMRLSKKRTTELKQESRARIKEALPDAWFPGEHHPPAGIQKGIEKSSKQDESENAPNAGGTA
jgi:hypothetical protein